MIQKYRLDKLIGPSGIFAGYVLLFVGVLTIYFTLTSIVIILLGALMAFSFQRSEIDPVEKRYRLTIVLFGIFPVGNWYSFLKTDTIVAQKFTGNYSTFSRSNRQLSNTLTDYRVMLVRVGEKKKLHLAKFETEAEAQELSGKLQGVIKSMNSIQKSGNNNQDDVANNQQ